MTWSPQQEDALVAVRKWFIDPNSPQIFRLFGYAGSGKTTLSQEIANLIEDDGRSQWDNVVLFDESTVFGEDRRRHLYTGTTRAAKTLTVVA